ncbi:MAG: hypothetical protein AB7G06_02285 [Bdellovibrionales bacterium]
MSDTPAPFNPAEFKFEDALGMGDWELQRLQYEQTGTLLNTDASAEDKAAAKNVCGLAGEILLRRWTIPQAQTLRRVRDVLGR